MMIVFMKNGAKSMPVHAGGGKTAPYAN